MAVCHAIHILNQSHILSTNARTLFGLANRTAMSWIFKRERSLGTLQERNRTIQHSAIDEEAFVVFCLAAYVLQVAADDCWSTPRKMMSQYVFYTGVCAILAKETSNPFTNMMVRSTDRGNCTHYNFEHTDTRYKG